MARKHFTISLPRDVQRGRQDRTGSPTPPARDTTGGLLCYYTRVTFVPATSTADAHYLAEVGQAIAGWFWKEIKLYVPDTSPDPSAVPASGWAILMWDKAKAANRWVPMAVSSGVDSIRFRIEESVCSNSYGSEAYILAKPLSNNQGCTASIPGADPYTGEVMIFDPCGELAYFADTELPGKIGYATYQYPLEGDCDPSWEILKLCGETGCE